MELRSHVNINMFILYLMFCVLFNIDPFQHPAEDYVCIYTRRNFLFFCPLICVFYPACHWPSHCLFIDIPMSSLLYPQIYFFLFYCFCLQILSNIWFWILSFIILFLQLHRNFIFAAFVCFSTNPDFLKQ